ncbi:L-threonine O-3-phosphate decarboxylase [Peptoclostridium litorale DSM 5388]|uniref:Aminotransferase n=1 Tax=Peptoclostridium litorale DSM 5388 TaxID=1121324 RepID=A0A069RHL9_PEPLI|nr:threonine-phosphate decarboxylase [Peptoclostridium litorale]KDR96506.1 putative threonine-phosphate decarboxylase CobD [Peptoclostridium litorale DSM 5388]SIN69798.1 L-threonine O-3-phosphate decarboxylase [Peptoclostridium litorale DSM 5388]
MNKHGGYFGKDRDSAADLSANINPLGPPKGVVELIKSMAGGISMYPEIDGISARTSLEKALGTGDGSTILGNGAVELIYLFARAIRPKNVLIVQPTFNEYKRAFEMYGSNVESFLCTEENCFRPNMYALAKRVESGSHEVVVICNPNNPTGVFTEAKDFKPLLDGLAKNRGILFADESFIDYSLGESLIGNIENHDVFILRSMTKFYSLAGLRIGYGVGHRSIIEKMEKFKEPWTVNAFALEALPLMMADGEYRKKTLDFYKYEKEYMLESLSGVKGLDPVESRSNFILCRVEGNRAKGLDEHLKKRGVYIRTCEDFYGIGDGYIRVAVKKRDYTDRFISAAIEYFDQC